MQSRERCTQRRGSKMPSDTPQPQVYLYGPDMRFRFKKKARGMFNYAVFVNLCFYPSLRNSCLASSLSYKVIWYFRLVWNLSLEDKYFLWYQKFCLFPKFSFSSIRFLEKLQFLQCYGFHSQSHGEAEVSLKNIRCCHEDDICQSSPPWLWKALIITLCQMTLTNKSIIRHLLIVNFFVNLLNSQHLTISLYIIYS